jgi:hypothetical protein
MSRIQRAMSIPLAIAAMLSMFTVASARPQNSDLALLSFGGKNGVASAAESLADQPRAAVARRHDFAIARVGHSLAGPFDLQSLIPVPTDVLGLGPDDPGRAGLALDALGHGASAAPCYVGQPCLPGRPGRAGAGRGATRR